MKKTEKRMRMIIMIVVSLLFTMTFLVSAEENADFDYYEIEEGQIMLTDYYGDDSYVEIPSQIDGKTVVELGYELFMNNTDLTGVEIPDTVVRIRDSAFQGCTNLTGIDIPSSVEKIDYAAFALCKNITSLVIPSSVKILGKSVFYGCDGLTEIVLKEGVESLGGSCFYSCDGIEEVTLPSTIETLGDYVFAECSNLKTVVFEDGVSCTGRGTFTLCEKLNSVTLSSNIYEIGDSCFNTCKSLKSFNFEGLTSIGNFAFRSCGFEETLIIPDNIKSIGREAFRGNNKLKTVMLGKGVESVAPMAFAGNESLTDINVDSENKYLTSENGVLFNKDKTILLQYPVGNTRKEYTIPESVTTINDYAFWVCPDIEMITISDALASVGYMAFQYTENLKDVYYESGSEDWSKIYIDDANSCLESANIHYYYGVHTHNYAKIVTQPTCTENGFTTYTCECGDSYVSDYVTAKGHKDDNNDYLCDNGCGYEYTKPAPSEPAPDIPGKDCSCNCHKSGFMGFIWKITCFFWKLLKMNPMCECGVAHY